MGAHISFLAYSFSSVTDDSLTCGLHYSDPNGVVTTFISKERLKILRKLISPNMHKHFVRYANRIQKTTITFADLKYLSIYQNGYINVTTPAPFGGDIEAAEKLFKNNIDINYKQHEG